MLNSRSTLQIFPVDGMSTLAVEIRFSNHLQLFREAVKTQFIFMNEITRKQKAALVDNSRREYIHHMLWYTRLLNSRHRGNVSVALPCATHCTPSTLSQDT
ncbi:hypothetical protein TNCT_25721 [Trichonephila clavata]|uniref:Uncharacterized protein n=1 Tax=Trichonephila clavata TaxID=2740835 RepID=A0A8X6FSS6_TRICU|nr:hypothetical protein TNCT_25721 [Trichonephila clavata]